MTVSPRTVVLNEIYSSVLVNGDSKQIANYTNNIPYLESA